MNGKELKRVLNFFLNPFHFAATEPGVPASIWPAMIWAIMKGVAWALFIVWIFGRFK